MERALTTMTDNLVNGNLDDAKRQAKRFGHHKIREFLLSDYGWCTLRATASANYLKGRISFEDYCGQINYAW